MEVVIESVQKRKGPFDPQCLRLLRPLQYTIYQTSATQLLILPMMVSHCPLSLRRMRCPVEIPKSRRPCLGLSNYVRRWLSSSNSFRQGPRANEIWHRGRKTRWRSQIHHQRRTLLLHYQWSVPPPYPTVPNKKQVRYQFRQMFFSKTAMHQSNLRVGTLDTMLTMK